MPDWPRFEAEHLNVLDYGADPSGASDSAPAFNAALDAANAQPHGTVYAPPGDYRWDSNVTTHAFTNLLGPGWPECRIVSRMLTGDILTMEGASGIDGFWMVVPYATATSGATLSGTPQTIAMTLTAFLVDFPSSGTGRISLTNGTWTAISWTGKTGSSLTGCTGSGAFSAGAPIVARSSGDGIDTGANTLCRIANLYMQNHFTAIHTGGVSNWILDCWIRDCIDGGILCDIDDGTPYIRNLWLDSIYAQPAYGVRCTQGSIIMSDSNIMRARIGLDFPMAAGGAFSPFICNCFLDNCADAGLSITGPGSPNVFDRGKFVQCWFASSTNGAVLNNTGIRGVDFDHCDFYLNSANGLQLLAAEEVGINFCRFANNTTAGINAAVTGGTPDVAVMNSLVGPVGTSLTGNGTGIIVSGTIKSLRVVGNNLAGNTGRALDDTSTIANPGQRQIVANTGLSVMPRPRTTSTTITNTTEAVITDGGQFYIPANTLNIGTTFFLNAHGVISATSPTLLPRFRVGTNGTTADTQICATAANNATSGTGWAVMGYVTIRTLGSSGTAIGNLAYEGTTPARTAQTATITINTTVNNFLSFTLQAGGTGITVTPTHAFWQVVQQ
jgi:Pectate lyase superfamily protein